MNLFGRDKKIALILVGIVAFLSIASASYLFSRNIIGGRVKNVDIADVVTEEKPAESVPAAIPATTDTKITDQAKKKVAKEPPKYSTGGKTVTKTEPDGKKIVSVCDSGSCAPLPTIAPPSNGSGPYAIQFVDETGKYSYLEKSLKDYLNSLKWGGEISSLYQLVIRDAGASGWEGQWAGTYTMQANGDITSAYGFITLNSYYHQSDPHFEDYMKLVLAHEYGHHYTLYHKWVDLDLPQGQRFPDSYYQVRPLTKATTATDYSLGWANCEAEIIAEDYSYLYSGYGYHAMSGTYGFPSAATRNWLNDIAQANAPVAAQPAVDNAPAVTITTPANGSTISDVVSFSANASDDIGVSKVAFYIGSTLLGEDYSAPYQIELNTSGYANGSYTLKAIAYDTSKNTEAIITVTFNNATVDLEKPVATFTNPGTNPYAWLESEKKVLLRFTSTDNIAVARSELYINDQLVAQSESSTIAGWWSYDNAPAGSYTIKAKVYDAAGNSGEATLTINKS